MWQGSQAWGRVITIHQTAPIDLRFDEHGGAMPGRRLGSESCVFYLGSPGKNEAHIIEILKSK
eukprot:11162969-Lingulodinium_polyedra.AAC.1